MAKDDFDAKNAIKELEDANDGVNFDNKIKDSIIRSTHVQTEIKKVFWISLKERIVWVILGASSFVILGLLKELGAKLIEKIK